MQTLCLLVAVLPLPTAGWAKKKPTQACTIPFSIIEQDSLGNIQQGVNPKTLKWLTKDLQKKYPDVCYRPPDPSVKTVLVIVIVPGTYNGTRVISQSNPSSGTITNNQGEDVGAYSGTNQSSTAVPYSFEYGKYVLTVETLRPHHEVTVRHRFEQNGIY